MQSASAVYPFASPATLRYYCIAEHKQQIYGFTGRCRFEQSGGWKSTGNGFHVSIDKPLQAGEVHVQEINVGYCGVVCTLCKLLLDYFLFLWQGLVHGLKNSYNDEHEIVQNFHCMYLALITAQLINSLPKKTRLVIRATSITVSFG